MNVDFFVFGVPDGFDLWEYDPGEKEHFGNFYDSSTDKVKFLVQLHPFNGRTLCYYNYLVYADVVGHEWRSNSFLGISLRFDTYCKDALKIYRLLDNIFSLYIIGGILQKEKEKIKYTVSRFSSRTETLNKIKSLVFELLQTGFSQDDFSSLEDFSGSSNTGGVSSCNLYECTPERVYEVLSKSGSIAISPYYQSSKDREVLKDCESKIQEAEQKCKRRIQANQEEYEKRLADTRTDYEKRLADTRKDYEKGIAAKEAARESALSSVDDKIHKALSSKEKEIRTLNEKIENLKKDELRLQSEKESEKKSLIVTIERLNREVERLKSENEKIKRKETQTTNSKSCSPNETSTETHRPDSFVDSIIKWVNSILRIFGFIVLLILLFRPNKPAALDYSNIESKVGDVYTVVKELQSSLNVAQNDFYREPEIDLSAVVIDIKEYKGGGRPLDKGTKYTVEAKNSSEKDAVWEVIGGEMENSSDPNIVYVVPNEGKVKITYRVGDSYKDRELDAQ